MTRGPSLRDRIALGPTRLRMAAIHHAAHAVAKIRYGLPDVWPSRHRVEVTRDVVYGPTDVSAHRLDVYAPIQQHRPLPSLIYVHGGGFGTLSKETHQTMALSFARRDHVVFNINYRLGPEFQFPHPLEDVADAYLWVRRHAAAFGGDPDRILVAGESAGGNLATALAIMAAYRRPEPYAASVFAEGEALRAALPSYGFVDLTAVPEYLADTRLPRWAKGMFADTARCYLGPDYVEAARRPEAAMASPLALLEGPDVPERPLVPFFVAVGTRDPLLRCAKRMKRALDQKRAVCELHIAPGQIHGFDAIPHTPASRAKWRAAVAFARAHGTAGPE